MGHSSTRAPLGRADAATAPYSLCGMESRRHATGWCRVGWLRVSMGYLQWDAVATDGRTYLGRQVRDLES
ncbi:MAG: hypothetical protein NVS2B12_09230 [Ktedonobacteraceae bacterium]